ncbi:TPA: hypothetical protein QCJ76_002538 [Enterobacter asburiae]|nr:hypothetical protein [Enterobacter asburiae]
MTANFALVAGSTVVNVVAGDSIDDMTALFSDFTVVEVNDDIRCDIGNHYNQKDGLFYDDKAMTILSGQSPA